MKKTIGLLLLLIQFACANHTPETQIFKIQYKPEKIYKLTTERSSEVIMNYVGPEKSLRKLRERGTRIPTISNKKTRSESVLKTGNQIDGNKFPVTMEVVKTISTDGKREIPDGTVFRGESIGGDVPEFDYVVLEGLDKKYEKALLQSLQKVFTQFAFPKEKMNIGEQFSVENTLSMPMEGSMIEMVVTNNYKLISITDGIASFDISQTYSMVPTMMNNSFKGTGAGKGQMRYDFANTMLLYYTLNTDMELDKKLDSFDFNLKAKSGYTQTINISKQ
jgi:hypothetical protein